MASCQRRRNLPYPNEPPANELRDEPEKFRRVYLSPPPAAGWNIPKQITPELACILENCDASENQSPEAVAELVRGYQPIWAKIVESLRREAPAPEGVSTPPAAAESNASVEARLREALKLIISDIEDYERVNNLAPSPGKNDCWQSVTRAKEALSAVGDEAKESDGGCICQDQHRRGYCTEPGCPYAIRPSDPTAERREIVALGDLVTVNELAPYFGDWRGVTLKVVGLRLTPDGEEWASVIEGDQRHRGNGQYDGETDGFNVQWLSKCAALDGGAGA